MAHFEGLAQEKMMSMQNAFQLENQGRLAKFKTWGHNYVGILLNKAHADLLIERNIFLVGLGEAPQAYFVTLDGQLRRGDVATVEVLSSEPITIQEPAKKEAA